MERIKPALLKGFDQEYLPHEQLQFNALVDTIRASFELYGFLPIETPSAELREVLTSKGAADKEIYAISLNTLWMTLGISASARYDRRSRLMMSMSHW